MTRPAAIEAERSILGGILLEPKLFAEVSEILETSDFSIDINRWIWSKMAELVEEQIPIDVVTLGGDIDYISGLLDGVPDRPSLAHYGKLVKDAALRRKMFANMELLKAKLDDPTESNSAVIESGQKMFVELSELLSTSQAPIFENYSAFEGRASGGIDWTVKGLIQRGANGLVLAGPKSGKSLAIADLAIALAAGQEWLEFDIPNRLRVGVVSREDYWALTHSRLRRYRESRSLYAEELDDYLWINGRGAQPGVMLDRSEDVSSLIAQLKKKKIEFLILDVMRVFHSAEENDSTDMQTKVINPLNRIAEEVGCSICMIHHSAKDESLSVSRNARGSSGIFGWAEFAIGIRIADEGMRVRQFECQIKAADAPQSFYWQALDMPGGALKLERSDWTPPKRRRGKDAETQESF